MGWVPALASLQANGLHQSCVQERRNTTDVHRAVVSRNGKWSQETASGRVLPRYMGLHDLQEGKNASQVMELTVHHAAQVVSLATHHACTQEQAKVRNTSPLPTKTSWAAPFCLT